jgi:hypothetical protein
MPPHGDTCCENQQQGDENAVVDLFIVQILEYSHCLINPDGDVWQERKILTGNIHRHMALTPLCLGSEAENRPITG